MSTPHEASLTEKERALLARLAAQAEADDPSLAATLRGRTRRNDPRRPSVPPLEVPASVAHWGWGVALAAVGLVMMLVALGTTLLLGLVGVVLTFAGVYRAASAHPGFRPGTAVPVTSAPTGGPA